MLRINDTRFLDLMNEQAKIGATNDGGLTRPSLSEADIQVRNLVSKSSREPWLRLHNGWCRKSVRYSQK